MSSFEQITSALNDHHDTHEYMRKLALADQLAYRAFLQFYVDYCPSPHSGVMQQSHPNAQLLSASIVKNSREVITLWQTANTPTSDINDTYQLRVHDLTAGQSNRYHITQKTILDTKNGDFQQYIGDATAIEFEAEHSDAAASLLVTNRGSLWRSSAYGAPQVPGDVRLLPYEIAHQLRQPSSPHYVGQKALQGAVLLPDELTD